MRIALGADHAGFELKCLLIPWLQDQGHDVLDQGAYRLDPSDDYPDFATAVASAVLSGRAERGVVICGSGVGACITANKVTGIRACLCHDTYTSRQGVEHDDMNVVCIGAKVIGEEVAREVLRSFLAAAFIPEERFQRRLNKLLEVEAQGLGGQEQ